MRRTTTRSSGQRRIGGHWTSRPDSDVDVLYVPRDGVHLGWTINDLSDKLEQVLGPPVDLVSKRALHARLKDAVLAQAQVVYAA